MNVEVFVVDNASTDKSYEYLHFKFPFVKWILNKTNNGFAVANNQAAKQATGDLILYLNPDTIIPEECLTKCIQYFKENKLAGALGIKMIDGSGNFLPESKRSFPTPLVSLFKLTGLSAAFPTSKLFGKYHLGNLSPSQNHEVDVLAGAFLMIRKELELQLEGFDETFFMYGEDVDLSYRIQQLGYKNIYFSESSIIHFKGESTKKGSLNYVKMFYNAMNIFVNKHYSGSRAKLFSFIIKIAIWFRAILSALFQLIIKIGLPVLDILIIIASFYLVKNFWVAYIREGLEFVPQIVNKAIPSFSILFLITSWMAGMYDKTFKLQNAIYAALFSIIILLAFYSLLPETIRFSRGVILFGGLTALLFILLFRWFLLKTQFLELNEDFKEKQVQAIVGNTSEYESALEVLNKAGINNIKALRISVSEDDNKNQIGTLSQIKNLVKTFQIKEVIFCEGELSFKKIIENIQFLNLSVRIKFFSKESKSIIGSESKNSAGNSHSPFSNYALSKSYYLRVKRVVDILLSIVVILFFPMVVFINAKALVNAWSVLFGKKTWIGYNIKEDYLPQLPDAVYTNMQHLKKSQTLFNVDVLRKMDEVYAANYYWPHDVKQIFYNIFSARI